MNLLWLVFIAFALVLVQTQVFRRLGSRSLTYKRSFNTLKCKEGEEIFLVEEIANRKLLPMPWIRLESRIPAALKFKQAVDMDISQGAWFQNHSSLFSMLPFTKITRRHRVEAMQRGRYRLQTATMTYGDLIGWSRVARTIEMDVELLVHPKPLSIRDVPLPSHSWQGDVTVRRWIVEDPFLVAGVRDYQPSDPFHRVDWKATARAGRLQVRQQDFTADRKLMVYVNFEDSETMWKEISRPELIELGLRYAAAIVRQASKSGMDVGFGCNGRTAFGDEKASLRLPPRAGKVHMETIYDAMARLDISRTEPFEFFLDEDVASRRRGYDYVIISAYMNETLNERVKKLRRGGNAVGWIPLLPPRAEREATADDRRAAEDARQAPQRVQQDARSRRKGEEAYA